MRKIGILLLFFVSGSCFGQEDRAKTYWTGGGEIIFSWAEYSDSAISYTGPPRFTCFFHWGSRYNVDFSRFAGFAFGIGIRNIGFITEGEELHTKIKRRTYTLGVPAYLKFGNMKRHKYIFVGGEYELAFHYKFKRFVNGDKVEKRTDWFTEETERFLPSVFVGYNYKGVAVKFQYYLDDFLNKDYIRGTNGVYTRPYANTQSQMFFVSLWINMKSDGDMRSRMRDKKKVTFSGF